MIWKEYEDYRRAILKKWDNGEYFIRSIEVKGLFNWKNSLINFLSPVSILTGINGSGKSTIVNALKQVYSLQNNSYEFGILSEVKSYEIKIINNQEQYIHVNNKQIIKKEFVLPLIVDITFNSKLYSRYKNSSETEIKDNKESLKQFDSFILPPELLNYMKELLYKDISSVERIIDEDDIENEYYVIKLTNGMIYDSYTMGSGEFYINQFLWKINEVSPNSIVIIEELENFVHCEAQKKILELLHKYSAKKNIQFILTTHSPTIIDHSDEPSRILILSDTNGNVSCFNNCSKYLAKDILGSFNKDFVEILVEDQKSKTLLETIISKKDPKILKHLIINPIGSDTYIKQAGIICKKLELNNTFGILDGDSDLGEDIDNFTLKLPWEEPPEKFIMNFSLSKVQEISKYTQLDYEFVKKAFEDNKLLSDFHEWFTKISEELGQDKNYLWIVLIKLWFEENKNTNEMNLFFNKFKEILKKLKVSLE
ncbi:MAG: AAA family ATPase [Candidatus Pacearchaeota archaeon]|jgi:predicted ATP-binding protein involved in virulence